MNALFIGRFQPFHLGHLSVIQKAAQENDRVFIGIGSAEANYRPTNPFTGAERFLMIESALKEAKIPQEKYAIIPVRNIENYALWPYHVELLIPPFERIYTGSDTVRLLYQNINQNRRSPYEIVNVRKEFKISSTQIRKLILENKKWEHLVPKAVTALLKEWNVKNRLKSIQESDK